MKDVDDKAKKVKELVDKIPGKGSFFWKFYFPFFKKIIILLSKRFKQMKNLMFLLVIVGLVSSYSPAERQHNQEALTGAYQFNNLPEP